MTRTQGWTERLRLFVFANLLTRFEWGKHDCAMFAIGAIDAQCGTTIAEGIRGRYDSEESAREFAQSMGWRDLSDAARTYLGEPIVRPTSNGEIVWIPQETMRGRFWQSTQWQSGALGVLENGAVYVPGPTRLAVLQVRALTDRGPISVFGFRE